MTQGHLNLKHSMPNIKDGRYRRKRPTKDQVTSKQPQWDLNEHPIFSSGMDGGMTQGHLNLKQHTPNIENLVYVVLGLNEPESSPHPSLKRKWGVH